MLADVALSEFPESWELTTLGEVVDACGGSVQTGPFGSQLHASDYVNEGIPSVMPKNIAIEGIVEDDIARITKDDATRLKKYLLEDGDIVYSRRGDVEKCALVKPEETGWLCGTGCLRVRLGKSSKITPEFLHAYLSSPAIREWISRNAIGATMPNLNTSILRDVPVLIPEAKDVDFISSSWHVFNSKIQLNRQTNQTLENMAQALFKSWFVDFDPVIDNGLAAGSIIPEPLQKRVEQRRALRASFETQGSLSQDQPAPLPEAIRQLFPASFVFDAEMGWIPEGWHIDQIKVLCKKIQNGGTPKRDNPDFWENGTIPWLASGEVRQTIVSQTEQSITDLGLEKSSAKWLPAGSTVIAMYGATAGQVAYVANALTTNQAVCGLIPNDGYQYFNYMALERCVHSLAHQARGSAQQNISKGIIEETKLIIPDGKVVEQFEKLCSGIFSKWIKNNSEEITLAKLRDTLLPKLISGELRIPEAQQQTEAAVA